MNNRKSDKFHTMKKITYRHLKRFSASVKSTKEEKEVMVMIVHNKIPLFLNYDKYQLPIYNSAFFNLIDTIFYIDGQLIECSNCRELLQ